MSYTIVTGLDLSELGDRAYEGAAEAATQAEDPELHVVYVGKASGSGVELDEQGMDEQVLTFEDAQAYVSDYVQKLHRAHATKHEVVPFEKVTVHVRVGDPADEIVKLAESEGADEIMVGTHGRTGVRKLLMGSVAEAVFNTASCPVVVVRPKSHGQEIEPAMTPEETATYEKFHKHAHGPRHIYHHRSPVSRRAPSSVVGAT